MEKSRERDIRTQNKTPASGHSVTDPDPSIKKNYCTIILLLSAFLALTSLSMFVYRVQNWNLWDFDVYYFAAKTWFNGHSPYDTQLISDLYPEKTNDLAFVYPSISLYAFLPFLFLPFSLAKGVWFLLSVLAFFVNALLVQRIARFFRFDLSYLQVVFFMSFFLLTLTDFLGDGNIEIFLVLMAFAGFYFMLKKNYYLSAVLFTIPSFFKIYFIFLGLAFIWGKKKELGPFFLNAFLVGSYYSAFYLFFPADFNEFAGIVFTYNTGSIYSVIEVLLSKYIDPFFANVLIKIALGIVFAALSIFMFLDRRDITDTERIVGTSISLFLLTLRMNSYFLPIFLPSVLYLSMHYGPKIRNMLTGLAKLDRFHFTTLILFSMSLTSIFAVWGFDWLIPKVDIVLGYFQMLFLFAVFSPFILDAIKNWKFSLP